MMTQMTDDVIQAVVFDWAGTLVDFGSCAPMGAFVRAFEQLGVQITMQQAREPMGMAKREHIRAILMQEIVAKRWQAVHHDWPDDRAIDRVFEAFIPLQLACIEEHSTVIAGVVDAVDQLRARGLKIGSTTGYTRELMDRVMPIAAEARLYVQALVTASDIDPGRPAPWLIFECVRQLSVYPMQSVVVVDDTVAGIEAGRNAGAWCVGVSRSGNLVGLSERELDALPTDQQQALIDQAKDQLIRAGAHVVIPSVASIVPVVEQLQWAMQRLGLNPFAAYEQVQEAFLQVSECKPA